MVPRKQAGTVSRLMRDMGLQGVIRGKTVKTMISDKAAPCPLDHVNRQFKAPTASGNRGAVQRKNYLSLKRLQLSRMV